MQTRSFPISFALGLSALLGAFTTSACSAATEQEASVTSEDDLIMADGAIVAKTDTVLKAQPIPAASLPEAQRCSVRKGESILFRTKQSVAGQYLRGQVVSVPARCKALFAIGATAYVFAPHFADTGSGGGTGTGGADVPYECQYTNGINDGVAYGANTCATTSVSMALRAFGIPLTAKGYYDAYRRQGYTYEDAKDFSVVPRILEALPENKGRLSFRVLGGGQGGNTGDLKNALDQGYLVVVGANLFQGHVILVTGYDSTGIYVNDPAGVWHPSAGQTGTAYDRCSGAQNNAKGALITWSTYRAANVLCGESSAVHLCPGYADLWMVAIKKK
jgi:hypothetical protein